MSIKKDTKKLIKDLADIIKKTDLTEIELEEDGIRIRVATSGNFAQIAAPPVAPLPAPIAPAATTQENNKDESSQAYNSSNPGAIKSPMVGTVYLSPDPSSPPFISVGDEVKAGQTLFIIEAMKVMNPINSTRAGTVKSILVFDSEPVEFEQPLAIIE